MKLPDFTKNDDLNRLKARMGLSPNALGSFECRLDPSRLTPDEVANLDRGGLDVDRGDLTVLGDGTFALKDRRVLVYIRDVHSIGHSDVLPKYHLANCSALRRMHAAGRSARYQVATRIDGLFRIHLIDGNRWTASDKRLHVCKNCLHELSFNGYDAQQMSEKDKNIFVSEFTPDMFFEKYPTSLHVITPDFDANSAPINRYSDDFKDISLRIRNDAGWRCQECSISLGDGTFRRFLHVHHYNAQRNDNSNANLIALCIECHAEKPFHLHMKSSPDYREFFRRKNEIILGGR